MLYGVDEVDKHVAEVQLALEVVDVLLGLAGILRVVEVLAVFGNQAGIVSRVGHAHHGTPADVGPGVVGVAAVVLVLCAVARHVHFGRVVFVAYMACGVDGVGPGDDDGLHLLPLAGEPALFGHLRGPHGVASRLGALGGRHLQSGAAVVHELGGVELRGLAHALLLLHLGAGGELVHVLTAQFVVGLCRCGDAEQRRQRQGNDFLHLCRVFFVSVVYLLRRLSISRASSLVATWRPSSLAMRTTLSTSSPLLLASTPRSR